MGKMRTGQALVWGLGASILLLLVYRTGKDAGNVALPPRGLVGPDDGVEGAGAASAVAAAAETISKMQKFEDELRHELHEAHATETQAKRQLERMGFQLNLLRQAGGAEGATPPSPPTLHTAANQPLAMSGWNPLVPMIYMLTPTYKRDTQKADLVRMGACSLVTLSLFTNTP
jgi:hypothetical protein